MKLKTICLTATALCWATLSAFGQTTLSGRVFAENAQSLPGAAVLLLQASDSSLVKGRLSGNDGAFKLEEIQEGNYLLRVTMLGYSSYQSPVIAVSGKTETVEWPAVLLNPNSTQIGEVEIVAKKPFFEQKIDRLSINVAGSGINAGNNALQVLQRSPGVLVNKQSNSISMTGKFGVLVMINGKLSRMPQEAVIQLLESTSADNIERIELIHTPPASFDADGNAGIINIVLKTNTDQGLNGSYSVNGGYGKREKYGAGMNFNFRKGITNLFGSYSYQFDHNPQVFTNYRGVYSSGKFLETESYSDRSPDLHTQNARVGADFQLSKKTVVGVVGTFFDRYWDMQAVNDIQYHTDHVLNARGLMYTHEINRWNSYTGNTNFSHTFREGQTLTMDADYVYYKIHNPSEYDIDSLTAEGNPVSTAEKRVGKETPIRIVVGKADYTQRFGKENLLEAGVKASRSLFDNDVRVDDRSNNEWVVDPTLTSFFKLREDVAAAYGSFSYKFNPNTEMKVGLRYEFTNTNLGSEEQPDVVDRQYGAFFPSIFFSRKIDEVQQLNLSYSRRIFRPSFTQLAPYLIFYDPSTVQGGNPSLQPSFIHAIRADYRYKVIGLTAEYNYESPSIRDVPFVDAEKNTQTSRPENIGNTHTAYLMLSCPWQPTKWWSMQSFVYYSYQVFNTNYLGNQWNITAHFAGANTTQNFTLPKKFSLEFSAMYYSPSQFGITAYRDYAFLSIGLQKELGPKWGKLNFNVNDILASSNWYGYVDQPQLNLLVDFSYRQAERTFMLTWTKSFGNNKVKEARQHSRGAEDELRRL